MNDAFIKNASACVALPQNEIGWHRERERKRGAEGEEGGEIEADSGRDCCINLNIVNIYKQKP